MELQRHPHRPKSTLRAWDAADDYLLDEVVEAHRDARRVLVVNDAFGGLALGLDGRVAATVVDSMNGRLGLIANAERNGLGVPPIFSSLDVIELDDPVDLVVMKVPRSLGQLDDQLHRLRPVAGSATPMVAAGMTKRIHTSTIELFEGIVGPTETSLARRKARLIRSTFDDNLHAPPNPWPRRWSFAGVRTVNHGGVFSSEKLDRGTELLLRNLPDVEPVSRVVDLGCGNGVIGSVVALREPDVEVTLLDESFRATASARATWAATHGERPVAITECDRMVNVVERESVDLVICNPPFHDDRGMGDADAWDMFVDSHAVLRPGGELRVVGNRHLAYHAKLGKIFGNCEAVASTKRFVVLSSRR